jgi:putative PEP-CTERM system histidine kinase
VALVSLVPFAAGLASLLIAIVSVLRKKPSPAAWCFFAGMAALGIQSAFTGLGLRASQPDEMVYWLTLAFVVESVLPFAWLCFAVTYSRTDCLDFLARWRIPLVLAGGGPVVLSIGFRDRLFQVVPGEVLGPVWGLQLGAIAKALNGVLLITLVVVLMNLEQTFRSAVGTMRWRIKFVVLALIVVFGTHIYVLSQGILFSANPIALPDLESGALLIGCVFLAVAYARTGLAEIDVYPSLVVLRSSLTILIVGGYLLVVGVLAQLVRRFGGAEIFQFQSYIVLLGMAGLAVLLLSDRTRQQIRSFSVRHFSRSQHDSVRIWTSFSQRVASVRDQSELCGESARLISETFDALSVNIWLKNSEGRLVVVASTARHARGTDGEKSNDGELPDTASRTLTAALEVRSSAFDLEVVNEAWAEQFRQLNPATFANGGNRLCVPLRSGEERLGAIVLADRVGGAPYSLEEMELLACIGDQITSVLLNLRLASEVASARELEAFRTMSAFFVHDLKNAAASLNLTLKNLPVHFHNPAFREDALRAIGNTAGRIDDMIARLSALRERPSFALVEADLNWLVSDALNSVDELPNVEVATELEPIPSILADRQQIQNVVINLVLNAQDAVSSGGRIRVRTEHRGVRVVLSVSDNGCGMSPAFLKNSLFRPFQSTKKKGLGIGLFQSRAIVQAHGGGIHVESEPGGGTTFLVSLPVKDQG